MFDDDDDSHYSEYIENSQNENTNRHNNLTINQNNEIIRVVQSSGSHILPDITEEQSFSFSDNEIPPIGSSVSYLDNQSLFKAYIQNPIRDTVNYREDQVLNSNDIKTDISNDTEDGDKNGDGNESDASFGFIVPNKLNKPVYMQPLPPLPPTPPINVLKQISAGSQVSVVENNILGKSVRSKIDNKPILRHETNSKTLTNRLSAKNDKPIMNKKSPTIETKPNTPSSSSFPSEKKSIKASGNSGVKLIHTPPRNRDTFTPSLQPNSPARSLKVKLEVNNGTSLNTPTTTTTTTTNVPSSNKIYSRIEFLKKVAVQFFHIPFPNLVSLCDKLNILYLF